MKEPASPIDKISRLHELPHVQLLLVHKARRLYTGCEDQNGTAVIIGTCGTNALTPSIQALADDNVLHRHITAALPGFPPDTCLRPSIFLSFMTSTTAVVAPLLF